MSGAALLLVLLVPLVLAFAFGIWAGLGYPGLYDRYERTGRAPRHHRPWWWVLGTGRRAGTAPEGDAEEEDEKEKEGRPPSRPDFQRRWRNRRGR